MAYGSGMDERIKVDFALAGPRSAGSAGADVSSHDVIVRWRGDVGSEAASVYATSDVVDIPVPDDSLKSLTEAMRSGLTQL